MRPQSGVTYELVTYSYSYSKTNYMHQCIKFIYFRKTFYTFRTVLPSIINSSRLYIQQQAFVIQMTVAVCTVLNS